MVDLSQEDHEKMKRLLGRSEMHIKRRGIRILGCSQYVRTSKHFTIATVADASLPIAVLRLLSAFSYSRVDHKYQ